jgi:hypothetical protein
MPKDGSIRTPIDLTLRPEWSFDPAARRFISSSGEAFSLRGELPKGTKVVHKVPGVARADVSTLNAHERDLRRYLQVILPHGESPARYLRQVRAWPAVEEAHTAPEVSLPRQA